VPKYHTSKPKSQNTTLFGFSMPNYHYRQFVKETLLVNPSGFFNLPKLPLSKEKENKHQYSYFLAISLPNDSCALFCEEGHDGTGTYASVPRPQLGTSSASHSL
jgi:hypothetical protein